MQPSAREREVVDSILERAANQYRVDGTELNVQVPEMLLRECQKEIEMVRFNLTLKRLGGGVQFSIIAH